MNTAGKTSSVIMFIYLFLTAAWIQAETINDSQAVVEQLNSAWNKHFNDANATALANLYAENAIVSPGNGMTLNSRAAIQELFSGFFENGLHNHTIETLSSLREGNAITQVARWQANGQGADGKKPVYGGILVSVFKQDDNGNWKAYLHLWNMSS